jgi:thioesterase domain-containing protein
MPADRLIELTADQIQTATVYVPATVDAPVRLFQTDTHDQVAFTGWESLCSGDYSVRAVTGDTHSMLEKPHVTTLCSELEAFLKSCE